jgi:cbb3-type cytochrome oxidase maturation protein
MTIIILLIIISLAIAIAFLLAFIWNLKSGQYDDTYTPSIRMLFDNRNPERDLMTPKPPQFSGKPEKKTTDDEK